MGVNDAPSGTISSALMVERATLWAARVVWAALPVTLGTPLGDAMTAWSDGVRAAATVALWSVWPATLVATLVPHPWR